MAAGRKVNSSASNPAYYRLEAIEKLRLGEEHARNGSRPLGRKSVRLWVHGVTIVGYTDLASRLAKQSSTLYSTNMLRVTEELCKTKDGVVNVNMEDDAICGLTVIKDGYFNAAPPRARYCAERRANWPPSVLIEVWWLPPALKTIPMVCMLPYSWVLVSM